MPPKNRIDREQIVRGALELVRQGGETALNARAIAGALGCSTQPVFSHFRTMEELKGEVVRAASARYSEYTASETTAGRYPPYKASGMAYIRFAKEEKELFKLLFMRDRNSTNDTFGDDSFNGMVTFVQSYTGLNEADATLFHLELWAFVHGIATMFATEFLDLDWELVSKMISDAYLGLRKQYGME